MLGVILESEEVYQTDKGVVCMSREDNVLDLKIVLINEMLKRYKLSIEKMSELIEKYFLLEYIDVCYESFCSTDIDGVIIELEDYVKELGGSLIC